MAAEGSITIPVREYNAMRARIDELEGMMDQLMYVANAWLVTQERKRGEIRGDAHAVQDCDGGQFGIHWK